MSKSIYLLLIALLLVLILGAGYLVYITKKIPPPVSGPTPTPIAQPSPATSAYLSLQPKLVQSGQSTIMEAYLSPPNGASQPVSMLNLKLDLKSSAGPLQPQASAVQFPDEFRQGGWTIPFNNVSTNPDGSVSVSFSAIYASPEAFEIPADFLFFSLPLKLESGATVTATIDPAPDTSEGYDKQLGKIDYLNEGQPISLQ